MAGSIQFSNAEWLVRSLDRNNNKVMDELQADPNIKNKIDSDKNGEISSAELTNAIKADAVEIRQGTVQEAKGFRIYVEGLETLKSVHSTAQNGISNVHVWTPTVYSDDNSRDRYYKLLDSNRAYDGAIDKLESSLHSIKDMTANGNDATTRAINIQAKTTLNSASWRTWTARMQQNISQTRDWFNDYSPRSGSGYRETHDPFKQGGSGNAVGTDPFKPGSGNSGSANGVDPFKPGSGHNGSPNGVDPFKPGNGNNVGSNNPYGNDPFNGGGNHDNSQPVIPQDPYYDRLQPHIREQEMINTNLQAAYATMNNSLKAIEQQTRDLPDLQANIRGTDAAISRAFSNITAIENSSESANVIGSRLRSKADATDAQATGRATPYAGVGAGIGLVAGGAIGFFAGGKNLKNAAIGAGIGAAAAAGIGALVGHSKDQGFKEEAVALRTLAGKVESYNPQADKQTAMNANEKLYDALFEARSARDIDRAQVVDKSIDGIRSQAAAVADRSGEILQAYQQK
ncbi:hypothetical protein COW36_16645 [bacterium (Candidatus Blackallbacteria) CG17_big_fil_post_rev_8_21_14_2_50_48_46]|uniref:EF-hand domain-containing protein n=1 Tax=bacterium (Candidatus Blackallbacteria) CG17_big_fil_post_rev_8_21_14_2_50_48_46 TaxID=2014261 RepID=A0A2M7G1I0_9BACT|nr:MAG: hypothetical protein COW64_08180 [bacterium (Candidatus Blackallbacteria) CG18_big_fil_WC_8_21_14_2_50_49_26]PIW15577.1 MAG: hypothetical protein COW36_16645 [bacterium (Candidatus Blackallbacteria) CG17_big_fil_post_rev_8_21_14_2_50_48_46]PIW49368.1 MAG: hypothetical protein COW20_06075 [bacterium (Candidatus Blackallbacteria) CG13_big_fil_rev_8_21_14_2_50_49_14]